MKPSVAAGATSSVPPPAQQSGPVNPTSDLEAARRDNQHLRLELELLADVSDLLSATLTPGQRLARLAELVVPRLADWCAVDAVGSDGVIRRLAAHHPDPKKVEMALRLQEQYPPDPNATNGVPQVIRTGELEWVPEIPHSLLDGAAKDEKHLELIRSLMLRSYICLPLQANGRILGALSLVHAESGRRYTEHDVKLAKELGTRAALVLENANLFDAAEASRAQLQSMFLQAPAPIVVLNGPNHVVQLVNEKYQRLVGGRVRVGEPLTALLPELKELRVFEQLDQVFQTGQTLEVTELPIRGGDPSGRAEPGFFNFVYQATRGLGGVIDGVMIIGHDVTEQVRARDHEAEARNILLRRQAQLQLTAQVGVAFTGSLSIQQMLQQCSEAMVHHLGATFARIWTVDKAGEILELQASAGLYTHLDGAHARVPIGKFKIGLIAQEAAPHLTNDVQNDPRVGDREWAKREGLVAFAGYPLVVDGRVIGVIAMFSRKALPEDTLSVLSSMADSVAVGIERKRAESRAREESETLEVVNQVGLTLAAELDTEKLVQAITDSATRLTGAQFGAFFYNVRDERGDAYMMYAISGVPREAFSKFPMPRNTQVFSPTFRGEGVVRVEDIRKDPRYGHNSPHTGMPKGHLPVVSYLAVPVVSRDGPVIGGLFFGHGRPGVFTERAERLVQGVAAQAAIAMDNARLFKEAQQLIGALERSNQELDQFAYVTSHDLKAPLRGIANLSQWIEEDLGPALTGESKKHLDMLRRRVHRMESLIEGILLFSRAGRVRGSVERVAVKTLVQESLELLAPHPAANIVLADELPVVIAERILLQQVFMNLLSNALKHAKREDVQVEVSAKPSAGDWQFTISDNGPGIPPEFHDRIWGIFQTLEARDKVENTGIGLAIVRKIVDSRGGKAWVESLPGEGARFHFTWPRMESIAP